MGARRRAVLGKRGKRIARKNLGFSVFAEHLGFSVWVLWTIVVINLGNVSITLSLAGQSG